MLFLDYIFKLWAVILSRSSQSLLRTIFREAPQKNIPKRPSQRPQMDKQKVTQTLGYIKEVFLYLEFIFTGL